MRSPLSTVVLAFLLALAGVGVVFASPSDDFARANSQFQAKQYKEAIQTYQQIIDDGLESAPLYFNLGNAYFKSGDLGHAILNYLRAKRLDPSDDDVKSNLQFARRYASVQLEGAPLNPVGTLLAAVVEPIRLTRMAWLSSLFFILLVGLLIVRLGLNRRHSLLKACIVISLILLVVTASLTTFKYRHEYLTRHAVIIAEQVQVRTGPSEQSDIELQGEPGLIVTILSENSDYFNVQFENQRRGWVKKDQVAVV